MKTVAAMIVAAGFATMAQAAETGTLTLACKGTTVAGHEDKPNPLSTGVIVNFTTGTVQGFSVPNWIDYPVKITGVNEVTVAFAGSGRVASQEWEIKGSIDRVTGDLEATQTTTDTTTGKTFSTVNYALHCKPTQ